MAEDGAGPLRARSTEDPQGPGERRQVARHLVQRPLTCKEQDPELFRLVRRHEAELDRWFTQRLGYRLHVGADTARLYKNAYVPADRPLRTGGSERALHQVEHVLLALTLASVASGPAVISLRDLIEQVRSAAGEAEITLGDQASDRRALVVALKWMIEHGLAEELHAKVDAYASDENADAVLKLRPDRIALLPLPALVSAASPDELLARADRRSATRQWMRARLVEDPVLYRRDLTDAEWAELRRRLGEEERLLDEMFGLVLESRAEGVAAVDPTGALADQRFPTGGTVGHAALLLLDRLRPVPDSDSGSGSGSGSGSAPRSSPEFGFVQGGVSAGHGGAGDDGAGNDGARDGAVGQAGGHGGSTVVPMAVVQDHLGALATQHARSWANDLVSSPARLTRDVVRLLVDLRLAELVRVDPPDMATSEASAGESQAAPAGEPGLRLLPAAARFLAVDPTAVEEPEARAADTLW